MKKKKGFVFVETLVVTSILTIALLASYSTYSALIIKEKGRISYNDSVYLYRTYYLEKFFKNFYLGAAKAEVNHINQIGNQQVRKGYSVVGCSDTIFPLEPNQTTNRNKGVCDSIIFNLHVDKIYLMYKDLGYLQNCKNWEGDCAIFAVLDDGMAEYIKTIGGHTKTAEETMENGGYRLVARYKEKKDGSNCSGNIEAESIDECQNFYATISIGDIDGK